MHQPMQDSPLSGAKQADKKDGVLVSGSGDRGREPTLPEQIPLDPAIAKAIAVAGHDLYARAPVGEGGGREPSPDEDLDGERGMAWWNILTDEDRSYWMKLSLGTSPADAWDYFKRCGAADVVHDGVAVGLPGPAHIDHPLRHYDRTCPACNAGVGVSATQIRETAASLRDNSMQLAKYPDMTDEARARELAALYIEEIADLYEVKQRIAASGVLVDAPRPRCKPGACPMPTVCGERCSRQDRAGVKACSVNRFTSRVCERGTQGCTVAHGVGASRELSEDEAAAVKFYADNPSAALFDLRQRINRPCGVEDTLKEQL